MKGGFFKDTFKTLAQNKFVLYFISTISILNLVGYLVKNNLAAIVLFIFIGFITANFSKNMIYILLIPLVLTNLLIALGFLNKLGFREAFKHKKGKRKILKEDDEEEEHDEPHDEEDDEEEVEEDDKQDFSENVKSSTEVETGKKRASKRNGFANLDDEDMSVVNTKIDYAKTVENAYDSLENILGGDGMKKMTGQASKLAKNQQQLFKAIDKMEPLMNMATAMLDKLENSSLAKIGGILQKKE